MSNPNYEEQRVRYILELDDKVYVIENVPANVDTQTGEQYFSPETVEKLHALILNPSTPVRVMEMPVYKYAG